ncbi:hypothetical protein [Paracoccus fistulariae]|uniref:DUF4760 domain-containing protein n=1 Tax=Paracoccus fistulariae TaxID=658446 RepID=A0ABY7SKP4_9RHOB|nr:hypothetical protein [Paracoccus fistulariae]MDB6181540.1 hypothetical protein [Paracoccus fistulariae]WCR07573.1 hypothetical protein JHX87_01595 [Paracoccus fistulariae]
MDWAALFLNERVIAALVTALVGGGVVAAGWVITHLLSRARDRALREERIADIQRALLAEIRAHVFALEEQQAAREMPALKTVTDEDYLPILPHDANDRMFRAIVEEVHLLPEWAIDPVVRYYRLLAVRAALAQDIRSNAKEYPRRAAQMFHDYLEITEETWDTGLEAVEILTASLRGGPRLPDSQAEVKAMLQRRKDNVIRQIAADLPRELDELRAGLNKRSVDRSDR